MSTVTASRGSRTPALFVVLAIIVAVAAAAVVALAAVADSNRDSTTSVRAPAGDQVPLEQYQHDSREQRDYVDGLIGRSQSAP